MIHKQLLNLPIGTRLIVRHGHRGSQTAEVDCHTKGGRTLCRKYSERRKRWTTTAVEVSPGQVLDVLPDR